MLDIVTQPDLRCVFGVLVMWSNCKPRTSMQPAAADRGTAVPSLNCRIKYGDNAGHIQSIYWTFNWLVVDGLELRNGRSARYSSTS